MATDRPTNVFDTLRVRILYRTRTGDTETRLIVPDKVWHGETAQHPGLQWLLDAHDVTLDGDTLQTFAMTDILAWGVSTPCRRSPPTICSRCPSS